MKELKFKNHVPNILTSFRVLLIPIFIYGMGVKGTVTGKEGNPLAGANIVVDETDIGTASLEDGTYSINLGSGSYTLIVSVIGYSSSTQSIVIGEDELVTLDFELSVSEIGMSALEVLASRAGSKTPAAGRADFERGHSNSGRLCGPQAGGWW